MPKPDDLAYPQLLLRAHGDEKLHARAHGLLVDIDSGEVVAELRV